MAIDTRPLLYGLTPIVDNRSRLLILGSFPSVQSLQKQEYYANPYNHFWAIMQALFGIERQLSYDHRVAGLLDRRIAVWDVIGACRRRGSGDEAIREAEPNALAGLLGAYPRIRAVVFNGTMAWQTARRRLPELFRMPGVSCERMPSTSPKHATRTLGQKVQAWSGLREWLDEA